MPTLINKKFPTIALAGNPNSGKSTLFNQMTGMRQKIANYPGITVEEKIGMIRLRGQDVQILDLPGTYSLSPNSEEERVACQIITGQFPNYGPLNGVFIVADGTTLERSLAFILQIASLNIPKALIINMADEMKLRGADVDTALLSSLLKMPVIQISALNGEGMDGIYDLMDEWSQKEPHPIVETPEHLGSIDEITSRLKMAKTLSAQVIRKQAAPPTTTERIDRVIMHKVWGPIIFGGIVLAVFQAIFSWAQPLMDLIDTVFVSMGEAVKAGLPPGLFSSFLADGIIAGVGSVVIFLPQILILFFFIAILENSGYMARAAMLMDKLMAKVGLQGKSFLPLISSYACAVPGIMAARTIENHRDRLATIFVAPFMTCSARLPVYTLLIAAFVPNTPIIKGILGLRAFTLLMLYLLGFLAAVGTAWVLKRSFLKSERTPFILEIPPYRFPPIKRVLQLMWDRARVFLRRAGTIILAATIILWALITFPQSEGPDQVRNSIAGQIGVAIEPIIEPLGFNWKIGVGLLSAQAAREVIVSSLATIYHVEAEGEFTNSLQDALRVDLSPLAAVSLLVFFVFAMQCMSTMAITKKETGGWKIPIAMFFYMNGLAYLASLVVYQGGKLIGF